MEERDFFRRINVLCFKTNELIQNLAIGKKRKIVAGVLTTNEKGVGTTNARIYTKNINDQLYCDVLQNKVKQFLAKTPATAKMIFQQDLAPWHTSNMGKIKLKLNVLE